MYITPCVNECTEYKKRSVPWCSGPVCNFSVGNLCWHNKANGRGCYKQVCVIRSVIGVSLSLEPGSGAVSRPLCAQPTYPLNGLNGHWRRFCSFETAVWLWLFCLRRVRYKFSDITGSTVVLTCCKGNGQSQWKTPIFGPSQLGNPLTDFDKIWNRWLRRRRDPSC